MNISRDKAVYRAARFSINGITKINDIDFSAIFLLHELHFIAGGLCEIAIKCLRIRGTFLWKLIMKQIQEPAACV